jgi:hypothetical protein
MRRSVRKKLKKIFEAPASPHALFAARKSQAAMRLCKPKPFALRMISGVLHFDAGATICCRHLPLVLNAYETAGKRVAPALLGAPWGDTLPVVS